MALASLSIAIAVAAALLLDAAEAGSAPVADAVLVAAGPPATVAAAGAGAGFGPRATAAAQFGPLTPDVGTGSTAGVASPPLDSEQADQRLRRVAVAAIGQAAGPPLTILDRLDEIARRDNTPEIIEPAVVVNPGPAPSPPLLTGEFIEATVSFYYCELGDTPDAGDGGGFCGPMRDGTVVYEGAAACAYVYLGQQFRIIGDPTERIYTCNDTGSAVHGLHRDVFFYSAVDGWPWLAEVGTRVTLEIVR